MAAGIPQVFTRRERFEPQLMPTEPPLPFDDEFIANQILRNHFRVPEFLRSEMRWFVPPRWLIMMYRRFPERFSPELRELIERLFGTY